MLRVNRCSCGCFKYSMLLPGILLFFGISLVSAYQNVRPFASSEYSFKILFPTAPERDSEQVASLWGNIPISIFSCSPIEERAYMVAVAIYPRQKVGFDKGQSSQMLTEAVKNGATNINGTIYFEKDTSIANYPGKEFCAYSPSSNVLMLARYFLVKNKLYMIRAIDVTGTADTIAMANFINSFSLLSP